MSAAAKLHAHLRSLLPPELRGRALDAVRCDGFLTHNGLARLRRAVAMGDAAIPRALPLLELGAGASRLGLALSQGLCRPAVIMDLHPLALRVQRPPVRALRLRADYHRLPLRDRACACVIAWETFHLTANPLQALHECRRVLHPGGTLIFSTYTAQGEVPGGSKLLDDWRPLLDAAGFTQRRLRNVSAEWRRVMRHKHLLRLQHAQELTTACGAEAEAVLSVSMAMLGVHGPAFLDLVERWEIVARAPAGEIDRIATA